MNERNKQGEVQRTRTNTVYSVYIERRKGETVHYHPAPKVLNRLISGFIMAWCRVGTVSYHPAPKV